MRPQDIGADGVANVPPNVRLQPPPRRDAPREPQATLAAVGCKAWFGVILMSTGRRSYLAFPGSTAFAAKRDLAAGLAKKAINALAA